MPDPLVIKRPDAAQPGLQFLIAVLLIHPLDGLIYHWSAHKQVHFENPAVNLLVHLLIVIVPLLWTLVVFSEPFQAKQSEEICLAQSTYFSTLKVDWWKSLMLWACPVF